MKALVCYANGSEDLEVTAITDILKRGGVEVYKCAINDSDDKQISLAHGSVITCDLNINEISCDEVFDLIAIPGGLKGSENCRDNAKLITLLQKQRDNKRLIGAICAAPGFVLDTHNLIKDAKATGYPGCTNNIKNLSDEPVVFDRENMLVTGKGPAFCMDFALALLSALKGNDVAKNVAQGMLI